MTSSTGELFVGFPRGKLKKAALSRGFFHRIQYDCDVIAM